MALKLCRFETRNKHGDGTLRRLALKTSFKQNHPINMLSVCSGILQRVATFFEEGGLSLSLSLFARSLEETAASLEVLLSQGLSTCTPFLEKG